MRRKSCQRPRKPYWDIPHHRYKTFEACQGVWVYTVRRLASRRTHEAPASPDRHRDFRIGICNCSGVRSPAARRVTDFQGFANNTSWRDRAAVPNNGSEYAACGGGNNSCANDTSRADDSARRKLACIHHSATTLRANYRAAEIATGRSWI